MTAARTFQDILAAVDKQQIGASDIIIAAAILAQAVDRHAETIAAAIKHAAEKPK